MIGAPKGLLTSCLNRLFWNSLAETTDCWPSATSASATTSPRCIWLRWRKIHTSWVGFRRVPDRERWLYPSILLLGIAPQAAGLFDTFFSDAPALAIEGWFEHRPQGLQAPGVIQSAYAQRTAASRRVGLSRCTEALSARLLVRLLGHRDPRLRLKAARAVSQWGSQGIAPLLDAADQNPLVQAVATYALLHLGELDYRDSSESPVPPLLDVEGREFSFYSRGGCGGGIGALQFTRVGRGSGRTVA